MTYGFFAIAIAIAAVVLTAVAGPAMRRFMIEMRRRRAIKSIASRNWTLPPDYKFDRDEANER